MKRPLFTVGITYLAAMAVAFYFDYAAALLMIPLLAFLLILIADDKSESGRIFFYILLTGMIAMAISVCFTIIRYAPIASLHGKNVIVKGTITEYEHKGRLTSITINGKFKGLNLIGSDYSKISIRAFGEFDAEVGDAIETELKLSTSIDYNENRDYYLPKGIFSTGTVNGRTVILKEPINPMLSVVARYRQRLMDNITQYIPNNRAGLVNAVLFGEKYDIDESIRASFNKSGISHVLAISGLHLSIVVSIISGFLSSIIGKKKSNYISIVAIWAFALLGGMGHSLIRSAIMLTVYFFGNIIDRESDGLSSLGFAGIVMTTINPFAIGDMSMQLSFLATLGILVLAKPLESVIINHVLYKLGENAKKLKPIVNILAITIAAQIFVAPIIILEFGFISLISPLTNLLISPIVPIALTTGLLTAFLGTVGIPSALVQILGTITSISVEIIVKISDYLAEVPYASVYVNYPYVMIWLGAMFAFGIILYINKAEMDTVRYAVMLGIFTLLVGITSHTILNMNTVKVIAFRDTPTVAIIKRNRAVIVGMPQNEYDAKRVARELDNNYVGTIDLIIFTNIDNIQGTGTQYMFKNRKVSYVIAPEDEHVTSYLNSLTKARLFPFVNMKIKMLGKVECEMVTHWGINIKVNDNNILKIFDDYDIIKGKKSDAQVLIDCDGMTYSKNHNKTMKYRQTMDGNQVFTLRE